LRRVSLSDQKPTTRSKRPAKAGAKTKPSASATGKPASQLIDKRIRELGGWRGETLARMRALILEAEPEATEEWKWMGTPVWSHHGIICTGESYAKVVKLTFARGAGLPDPSRRSIPAWKATCEGRSTFTKERRSTQARSGHS
jgi:hypothetical protein